MTDRVNDFNEFNRALDRLMEDFGFGETSVSAATLSSGDDFEEGSTPYENIGKGSLIVQVSTASGSLPIAGARVTITAPDGTEISEQLTNSSGRTSAVELDAPSSRYSQQPGKSLPYSVYNLRVEHPGFYTERFLNIAVFDRIASIQPVALTPLDEDATPDERIVIDENSGNGLPDNQEGR